VGRSVVVVVVVVVGGRLGLRLNRDLKTETEETEYTAGERLFVRSYEPPLPGAMGLGLELGCLCSCGGV
jgi:hypothetical protein